MLKEKRYAIAAASIITYGGLLAIVLALTIASVVVPIFVNHDWQQLAIAMLAASCKSTFGIDIDTMDAWAKSAHESFPVSSRPGTSTETGLDQLSPSSASAALIFACASSSDSGDGLRSTFAKPKSLRLLAGKT